MGRKKKHPEHVNHERWLISYADFITLLFAFFVVMFAVSQVDSKKVGRFTESFSKAVGIDMFPQPGHSLLPGEGQSLEPDANGTPKEPIQLPDDLVNLQASLVAATMAEKLENIQIMALRNELVLRLSDNLLFDSGDDALKGPAAKVVEKIAVEIRKRHVMVRVEGHTDNRPIRTARFRSNWDLSTARATAVVQQLAADGIEPNRLSAAGYGEFHPLAPNDTDAGRKKNRRVDLVISVLPKGVSSAPEVKEMKGEKTTTDKGERKESDAGVDADHPKTGEHADPKKPAANADREDPKKPDASADHADPKKPSDHADPATDTHHPKEHP